MFFGYDFKVDYEVFFDEESLCVDVVDFESSLIFEKLIDVYFYEGG